MKSITVERTGKKVTKEQIKLGAGVKEALAEGEQNPPGWVEDETAWDRAKVAARKSYDEEDEAFWPVVTHIYQNIVGAVDPATTGTVRAAGAKDAKKKQGDYKDKADSAKAHGEVAHGKSEDANDDDAEASDHHEAAEAHQAAADKHRAAARATDDEEEKADHIVAADQHEAAAKSHLRKARAMEAREQGDRKGVVLGADGRISGKPAYWSLVSMVTRAIQEDPRWDTDRHGYAEGSPQDIEPYCCDVVIPDDDGTIIAIIRTDEGKTVKHGFHVEDGGAIVMDEGDSEPTESYTIYTRNPKERRMLVAREASASFDAEPPKEFMWMPAGVTTITCTMLNDSEERVPIRLTVECDEKTAEIVEASFEEWSKKYPKQKPFGCVEHREEEAAFWPQAFAWKDDPEPGVFCSAEWSALGERNVKGKIHRSFSPSFATDAEYDKAKPLSAEDSTMIFPKGARGSPDNPARVTGVAFSVGSLTNKPAFKNILPVRAKQAEPQPGQHKNADEPKFKMKVKLIKARGADAAGTVVELADDEAVKLIASGDALDAKSAETVAAREAENKELKAQIKEGHVNRIKEKIVKAKERNAIAKQDEMVQAKCLERLDKGADVELLCELIDGMQSKDITMLASRLTQPYRGDDGGRVHVVRASLQDAGKAYVAAREPMNKLIRAGDFKEAFKLSFESATIAKADLLSVVRAGGDFMLRDTIQGADVTDPDSQVGTLSTGLLLMRNLGFLKNKLAWMPYLTTDLRNEPAQYKQPILTRYITPPNVLTFVSGVGYTSDAAAIAAHGGDTTVADPGGTLTKSVPSSTDVTVTLDQNKGVELEFPVSKLASTIRNLFAEQYSAQLYSLAEAINQFVLAKIFAATWTGIKTSFSEAVGSFNLASLTKLKSFMTVSKIPDVGRFALLHTFYHDKLLQDGNMLTAKAILSLINKDVTAFESGELPSLFGIKPLESQLSAANSGVLGSWTDDTNMGTINQVGFAGNMSSMLFVARVPQDYTSVAQQLGVPATAAIEIVTEPDSGLSMMVVRYVDHAKASVSSRCALMYGAAQGDPRVGIVIKPS